MAKFNIYRILACATFVFAGEGLPVTGLASGNGFTVQGSYAVHGIIGSHVGSSIGVYNVDSNGGLSGYAVLNLPSADGQSRNVTRVVITGTVTVNSDGRGQANYTAPLPDGSTATITEDFVITNAQKRAAWFCCYPISLLFGVSLPPRRGPEDPAGRTDVSDGSGLAAFAARPNQTR